MQLRTTSTQRTYRYLRLSIVGAVVVIAASLVAQIATAGAITSVSAAYYSSAQIAVVGALLAVALALVALSGRSVEQVLLDLAAVLIAVVAVVPTPVAAGDVAGLEVPCAPETPCVPPEVVPAVANAVASLLVVAMVGLIAAVVLAAVERTLTPRRVVSLSVLAGLVAVLASWWFIDRDSFLLGAHNVAAVGFFALIAAVAVIAAIRPASTGRSHRRFRVAYVLTAAAVAVSLVFLAVVVGARALGTDLVAATGLPLILLGEAVALVAFAAFWIIQTVELWDEPDPAVRA